MDLRLAGPARASLAWLASLALLAMAPPAGATVGSTDVRLFINFMLEEEDPQSGPAPLSSFAQSDLGSVGTSLAFSEILGGRIPPSLQLGASIDLTSDTQDDFTARSFGEYVQRWGFFDLDPGRTGSLDLKLTFDYEWDFRADAQGSYTGAIGASFWRYDANAFPVQFLGDFSCSASSAQLMPQCSSSGGAVPSFSITDTGVSYAVSGDGSIDFNGGMINRDDNYFGVQFFNQLDLADGMAGDFAELGSGNTLAWSLESPESTVTVTAVPEPAAAALVTLGLLVAAGARGPRRG